ncbi:MAG TPA: HAMP domain-containing sensor histidine kinase [Bacilli bacterium]|nr:HAMP domain-containing sensor histidine kinase [Bacilli bacterium]
MKLKKNSLKVTVWLYLTIFSIVTLLFIWVFQVGLLNTYYQWSKSNEMNKIVKKVASIDNENYEEYLDEIANQYGVCIELYSKTNLEYRSNNYNRGCFGNGDINLSINKRNFIFGSSISQRYYLVNPKYNNNVLMYAIKNDNYAVFISTSLTPLDSTIKVLQSQFIIVTIVVLLLTLAIAYFISKRISEPIVKLNKQAKNLAQGNYNVKFDSADNIDEINELEDTLNTTVEELSKIEETRKELLANVSHDLKTPLTMIIAYAEMVRDLDQTKDKREESLNVIINESERLNLLVNDILELSKVEAEQKLEISSFDLNEMIKNIIKTYEIYKITDNYNIEYNFDKKVMINADKKRIEQVFYNLLNNAINYTGEDKKVIIRLIEDKRNIRIEIIDSGKGIDKKDIKYIWDKYYKADKTHSREKIGSGIGLSIVKTILVKHGYEYGVISKKGKGTTFYFEIKK